MMLFIKLLLAHVTGDFLLQPHRWVIEKEQRKYRSPRLYLHAVLHGMLSWLLVWDPEFWLPALCIVITHFIIDLTKVSLQHADNRGRWFAIDQFLHVAVLACVWYAWERPEFSAMSLPWDTILIIITAAVVLTNPVSVVIRMVISQWTPDTLREVSGSLPDAGKFIGYLERLLILLFILLNRWEAVGFLLAAKSVFRFGNLKESQDRKLTEYVLIGTLLSFSIALLVALLTKFAIRA